MNTTDPVGLTSVASHVVAPVTKSAPIKPPEAADVAPKVSEQRHQDIDRSESQGLISDDEDMSLLEEVITAANEMSEADMASVIDAQAKVETQPSAETLAEASRIREAFQAGVSMTSLLKIIRGADLATISMLLGEVKQSTGSQDGTMMPV